MNVTEFKRITGALSTYANTRKTEGPESRIGVQAKSGTLKLIAGNSRGGIAVNCGPVDSSDRLFFVSARPLIGSAAALKGKIDLRFGVVEGGLSLVTDKGGRVDFPQEGPLREAGFARKPNEFFANGSLAANNFKQLSKLFDAVSQDSDVQTPTLHHYEGKSVMTAISPGTHSLYASLETSGGGDEDVSASAYMDFWRSLKACENDGDIQFGLKGVLARSGNIECFSARYFVSPYNRRTQTSEAPRPPEPWPTLGWRDDAATARVSIDRRSLIEAIKSHAPDDELSRVTLRIDTGTLGVFPFGAEAGMTFPANTQGVGVRSVQSKYALDMLRAMESKEVELAWGKSPAIRLFGEGYDGWTIFLAPVTLVA